MGVVAAIFPAAVLGGIGASVTRQFLRFALGAAAPRRAQHDYSYGRRAEFGGDLLPGDFLDGAALRAQVALELRRGGVFAPRRA